MSWFRFFASTNERYILDTMGFSQNKSGGMLYADDAVAALQDSRIEVSSQYRTVIDRIHRKFDGASEIETVRI